MVLVATACVTPAVNMTLALMPACCRGSVRVEQITRVAAEARFAGVGVAQLVEGAGGVRHLIQPFFQNGLHAAIPHVLEGQCPTGGGIQAHISLGLAQSHHTLSRPEALHDSVGKESLDQCMTEVADLFGLIQTPLRVAHLEGHVFGRQMLIYRAALTWVGQTRMGGEQGVLVIQAHGGLGQAYVQLFAHQGVRCRVALLMNLYMAITVQLGGGPGGKFRRLHR